MRRKRAATTLSTDVEKIVDKISEILRESRIRQEPPEFIGWRVTAQSRNVGNWARYLEVTHRSCQIDGRAPDGPPRLRSAARGGQTRNGGTGGRLYALNEAVRVWYSLHGRSAIPSLRRGADLSHGEEAAR